MLTLIIDVLVTSGLLYALATALPGVRLKSFGTALAHPADRAHRLEPERCFRHQLLLPRPYLVLTKPLRLDIQCQRGASVKIGWKYLDD